MSDLASGEVFVDGQTVNAARLNNMVNAALAQPGLISGKANVTPAGADSLLLLQGGVLKKCLVSGLPSSGGSVSSVGMTAPAGFSVSGSPVTAAGTLALSLSSQSGNLGLRSPADGSAAVPTFRAVASRDLRVGSVSIAASNIDWNLGTHFYKTLSGTFNPTFSNEFDGGSIYVALNGGGSARTVNWPGGVTWTGAAPSQGAGWDLYLITFMGGIRYGTVLRES